MPVVPQTVENEYKKNPLIKKEDIAALREWLQKNPHLPEIPDIELIVFYHSCQRSMELAKTTIDNYFTLRTHMSDYFTGRDPKDPKHLSCLETIVIAPLPQLTAEGNKVILCKLLDPEPTRIVYQIAVKCFLMIAELCQREEGTYPGFVILVDMHNIVLAHLSRLSIAELKKTLLYLQIAMPVQLKQFHFINTPSFMETLLGMMKPFMNKSLLDMIKLHQAPNETLYEYIPKDFLPVNMGGKYDDFDTIKKNTIAKLIDNRDFLLEDERVVNESKRPGKPKDASEIFGVDGSFKKLDID